MKLDSFHGAILQKILAGDLSNMVCRVDDFVKSRGCFSQTLSIHFFLRFMGHL